MPAILIFQKDPQYLTLTEIGRSLSEMLGVTCSLQSEAGRVAPTIADKETPEFRKGTIYVEIPDLEADEGEPIVSYDAAPRGERDEAFRQMIQEILSQDESLAESLTENSRDIILSFDESPAGVEAGSALAYAIASETASGLLVIGSEDGEGTVWFSDAEEFADLVFGDDDDEEDYEDDEEEEEDEDDK